MNWWIVVAPIVVLVVSSLLSVISQLWCVLCCPVRMARAVGRCCASSPAVEPEYDDFV